jgi:hypothetical protein
MKNSKGQPAPKRRRPGRERSKERGLVLLDQGPLRRAASSECNQAMERLEKARAEWKRFEREDKPAFERWMAATFGALLSRVRETAALVGEKETLVREVEMEMVFGGMTSERAAFARVQHRRSQPASDAEPATGAPPPHGDDDAPFEEAEEMSEFEQELLFEELLIMLGMNPDRMSQKQYAKMFAEFKEKLLGEPAPEPPLNQAPPSAPPKPEQSRIKELYRLLVRRLHPDTRADNDAEVSSLWHEVQEAYEQGNVDRLEMLLALTDILSNATGDQTSLFQLRSVLAELCQAFDALQRNLRAAKKEYAWNFVRLKDRTALEKRVRRELESDLALQQDQLRQLEALIARWSAPRKARKKPATMQRQADFLF